MKPLPFKEVASLLGQNHASIELVRGAAIDSRKIQKGDLFFALPGQKVDGHTFLAEAASKGAAAAVVQKEYKGSTFGLPALYVEDVLLSLQELARLKLAKTSSKVIAITGSVGKTTTKEFAASLLGSKYSVFASPFSYNSQASLPLNILMTNETEDYLILEMGMTHAGQIKNLTSIAPPDIALITTVAVQHANNFSDGLAGISREKASVFMHPKTRLGIMHRDMPYFSDIFATGNCSKKTFSLKSCDADFSLEFHPNRVRISTKKEGVYDISINLPLNVYYHNFLAAVCLARSVDVPWELISEASANLKLPPMRFERVEKQGIVFINDAYNANPDSMKAALEHLPKPEFGGKVIAVLGEMDALGMYSETCHAMVAEKALEHADHLLCLGNRCETMLKIWNQKKKPVQLFESRESLEQALKSLVQAGDVVLLKGARAHGLECILNAFDSS